MDLPNSDAGRIEAATIKLLKIARFRGINSMEWHPEPGLNLIVGGGDAGKTTVLDAISLLLSPAYFTPLTDTDYHRRTVEDEFLIEAVMALPPESEVHRQYKPFWPWEWDGTEAIVPNAEGPSNSGDAVYRFRVRGTEDLEPAYEVLQPDGSVDNFIVTLRRSIGLVRIGSNGQSDRDLRLVRGSALDRLLSDRSLRSRVTQQLAEQELKQQLTQEKREALEAPERDVLRSEPARQTRLGVDGGPGASIASMVGLTSAEDDTPLPLANWGAGTRRLSALAISDQVQEQASVVVVDEIERGLEPYRQRLLVRDLQERRSQVFATTHSPFVIKAAESSRLWFLDQEGLHWSATG